MMVIPSQTKSSRSNALLDLISGSSLSWLKTQTQVSSHVTAHICCILHNNVYDIVKYWKIKCYTLTAVSPVQAHADMQQGKTYF